ncbi:MAG: prevent-host-death protein [Gammaproteobacteria bacterium SHHR-1]|uniref:prevent-host-death protein n=1 Tax=Magnetovirga frankeli TaxID=947516 RepID=UPI0012932E35|nr:prevent-host-death protein [gamma proteobacterium SS-5]
MKVFTYSEARQNLSKVLAFAQLEEVEIKRKDGTVFSLRSKEKKSLSPFQIAGIKTKASTQNILDAIESSRMDQHE